MLGQVWCLFTPLTTQNVTEHDMLAQLVINHDWWSSKNTSCRQLLSEDTEWICHREPLSGNTALIKGERSMSNSVCLTPVLPGIWALQTTMKSPHFPQESRRLWGHILFILHHYQQTERHGSDTGKVKSEGWWTGTGVDMFVSFTHWCQQKFFLACQRKGSLTGGLRDHKSAVILSMIPPLALHKPTFELWRWKVIHNFPWVAHWISLSGITFNHSYLSISVSRYWKPAWTSRSVQESHWTVSTL